MPWLDRFRRAHHSEDEVDQEIRFHLAEEARLRIERGETPAAARRRARQDFGSTLRVHEEIDRLAPSRALETIWRDLTYGLRLLRRDPTFTAAAILSLALG